MENMTTVSFDVPSERAQLIRSSTTQEAFERNALLIYPFIQNLTISHGKAAEILGVHKLDLIAFYGSLGIPHLDVSEAELNTERAVFHRVKGRVSEL